MLDRMPSPESDHQHPDDQRREEILGSPNSRHDLIRALARLGQPDLSQSERQQLDQLVAAGVDELENKMQDAIGEDWVEKAMRSVVRDFAMAGNYPYITRDRSARANSTRVTKLVLAAGYSAGSEGVDAFLPDIMHRVSLEHSKLNFIAPEFTLGAGVGKLIDFVRATAQVGATL